MYRRSVAGLLFAGALVVTACAPPSQSSSGGDAAADFPSRPMTMIVPFAAGGSADIGPRALAPCFEEKLGQPLVIQNEEAGGTTIGTRKVLEAKPDGYTLGLATTGSIIIAPEIISDVPYNYEDIYPLGVIFRTQGLIMAPAKGRIQTGEQLIEQAKKNPRKVTVGTAGSGTLAAIELERLAREKGVEFEQVPFNGSGELFPALLGGHVDAAWLDSAATVKQYIQTGKVIPLVAASSGSVSFAPDAPTMPDLGYPDAIYSDVNYMVIGPKGFDAGVSQKISDMLASCLQDDDVRKALGEEYIPSEFIETAGAQEIITNTAKAFKPILEARSR